MREEFGLLPAEESRLLVSMLETSSIALRVVMLLGRPPPLKLPTVLFWLTRLDLCRTRLPSMSTSMDIRLLVPPVTPEAGTDVNVGIDGEVTRSVGSLVTRVLGNN